MIHPTAIIEDGAVLGQGVEIGPYCVVGPNVELGDRVKLKSHVVIGGYTKIGEETEIYPFASIGHRPQDLKYRGENSRLLIGARNMIREHVTMNPGTQDDKMETIVGDDNVFMVGVHIAHDCIVGSHVIMSNNATLAGHVEVGDHVIIGGLTAIRQFVRIGSHAMIGGMCAIVDDVIPYGLVMAQTDFLAGLNLIGLQRKGFSREKISQMKDAYEQIFEGNGTLAERIESVSRNFVDDAVQTIVSFAQQPSKAPKYVSLCQPKKTGTNG